MKITRMLAAAGLVVASLGVSTVANAQHYDRHDDRSYARDDRGRGHDRGHDGYRHDNGHHYGQYRHDRRCRTEYRHHRRVTTCYR